MLPALEPAGAPVLSGQSPTNATSLPGAVSKRQLVLSAVFLFSVAFFVLISLAGFNHNDFMYAVAPAVWAQHGALYTDVPFVQAPLSLLVNASITAITGNVNIFLPSRILSILFVLLAVLLPVLNRSRIRNPEIWVLYVALCLTNVYVTANTREIGNYSIALLLLSASIAAVHGPGPAGWRGFASCAAIGLATSAKLYFALICPAVFLYFLLNEHSARDPRVVAACTLGFLAGFAPILFFLARDYQAFLRWNVHIHQTILSIRAPHLADSLRRIGPYARDFALLMSLPIAFVIIGAVQAWRRGGVEWREECGKLTLLAVAAVMAISPLWLFDQYLGPLALLLFLFSAPWDSASKKLRSRYVIFASALLCVQSVIMGQWIVRVIQHGNLAVVQVLEAQSRARQIVMHDYHCERKLYSTEPLLLLENGVKYPPELAAGPFLTFIRGGAVAGTPKEFDLDAHLKQWNPDVVIWGYFLASVAPNEIAVDRAIRDYATKNDFVVANLGLLSGQEMQLAYRPGCKDASRQ
jgi:hypothetical protein